MNRTGEVPLFLEPANVTPKWSAGLASVDVIGGDLHFALYVEQRALSGDGEIERLINHRHIVPAAAVAAALPDIIKALPRKFTCEVMSAAMMLLR